MSLQAENMIKVPRNGQEVGQGQVRAKAIFSLFYSTVAFQRGENMKLNKREQNCVPINFLGIQGSGDLV